MLCPVVATVQGQYMGVLGGAAAPSSTGTAGLTACACSES